MAHIGLTPQSVNALGGYRVQGRGDEAAHRLLQDAKALQHAGAFAVVMEVVPSEVAAQVTRRCTSRRSASAPGRPATRRCSSGRTWPGCGRRQAGEVRQGVRGRRRRPARRRHPLRRRGPRRRVPVAGARVQLSVAPYRPHRRRRRLHRHRLPRQPGRGGAARRPGRPRVDAGRRGRAAALRDGVRRPAPTATHDLRWFTPAVEVDLCGHATLATTHVLHATGAPGPFAFHTRSGVLRTSVAPTAGS